MNSEILTIKEYIAENILGSKNIDISEKTELKADLGIDSLRLVEVIVSLEDMYKIILDESDLNPDNLITVGDLEKLVFSNINKDVK